MDSAPRHRDEKSRSYADVLAGAKDPFDVSGRQPTRLNEKS
jgi:hypothetical protein